VKRSRRTKGRLNSASRLVVQDLQRSLAKGGRKMYLHQVREPFLSLAATESAAWRLNPWGLTTQHALGHRAVVGETVALGMGW